MNGVQVGSQNIVVQRAKSKKEGQEDREQRESRAGGGGGDMNGGRHRGGGDYHSRDSMSQNRGGRSASRGRQHPPVADCMVVMLGTGQKEYGELVARRISIEARLHTVIRHRNQETLPKIVENVEATGAQYCCVLGSKNEQQGTCNFRDFQDHRKNRLEEISLDQIIRDMVDNDRRKGEQSEGSCVVMVVLCSCVNRV